MPSVVYNRLKPDDKKRLRRLKLGLWLMTVVFGVHALFANFPELYPVTRFGMYSYADGIPFEIPEGYLIKWKILMLDEDGNDYLVSDSSLSGLFRFNSASMDLINLNFAQLTEDTDEQKQRASAEFFMDLLKQLYDVDIRYYEVQRHSHLLDYSEYPSVDYSTPDFVDTLVRVTADNEVIPLAGED